MLSEPIAVTLLVIEALEALDVPYLIGGSLPAQYTAWRGRPRTPTWWPICVSSTPTPWPRP